ncbi:MAG: CAP domain-containing protein [Terriglobales bacterium]
MALLVAGSLLIAVHVIVGLGSPPALVQAAASSDLPSAVATSEEAQNARALLQMINEERRLVGAPPLVWNDRLAEVAQAHARLLAERKELTHDFPGEPPLRQRMAATNLRLDRSGENVGFDSSIAAAHEGFMHSPRHRENMLNPIYNTAGIGVVRRGKMFYITEDFARVLPDMTEAEAQAAVEKSFADLRRSAGQPLLRRVDNARAHELACSMAHDDELNTSRAMALPGARHVAAYTATQPSQLSPDVVELRNVKDVDRYALGVCFARTPKYPGGVFWVLMVFFSPQMGTSA